MIRVNTLFKYVCYHPMEHQILTTGTDRKVGYWETYDGSMIRELDGSLSGSVNALDISTDGTYFVSGGDDKLIKVTNRVLLSEGRSKNTTGIRTKILNITI
jgi:cilia- and flagella-associated protein 52